MVTRRRATALTPEFFGNMEKYSNYTTVVKRLSAMLDDSTMAEQLKPMADMAMGDSPNSQKAVNQLGRMLNIHSLVIRDFSYSTNGIKKAWSLSGKIADTLTQGYPQTLPLRLETDEADAMFYDTPYKGGITTTLAHLAAYHESSARTMLEKHPALLDLADELTEGKDVYKARSLITVIASHVPILNDILDKNPALLYKPVYLDFRPAKDGEYTTLGESIIKEMIDATDRRRHGRSNITAVTGIFRKMTRIDTQYLNIIDEHLVETSERNETVSGLQTGKELKPLREILRRREAIITEILRRLCPDQEDKK